MYAIYIYTYVCHIYIYIYICMPYIYMYAIYIYIYIENSVGDINPTPRLPVYPQASLFPFPLKIPIPPTSI